MSLHWAEFVPAAPLVIDALPALLALAGLIVALGLIRLIDGFVRALFGALAWLTSNIPFVGGLTSSVIHGAENAISEALGNAITWTERKIAHQFHNLARVASRLWHAIEGAAELIFALATLGAAAVTLPILHHITRPIYRQITRAEHIALEAIRHALHAAKAFTHSVAQGVYPRIRALEHEVTRTIPREIRHARSLAREAEDGVARLWKRVKALEQTIGAGAIAAAVATALAALGLDWLGCRDGASRAGRSGCNLWDDLGAVFGLLALEIVALDFDTLVHTAQDLTEEGVSAFDSVFGISR